MLTELRSCVWASSQRSVGLSQRGCSKASFGSTFEALAAVGFLGWPQVREVAVGQPSTGVPGSGMCGDSKVKSCASWCP